jgi:hypothetical protein
VTKSIREAEVRSFGEIAGEIGHELNNQLGIISGRAELAQLHLERGRMDDVRAGLEIILRQTDRMRLLSERLRGMRGALVPLSIVDPREIVGESLRKSPLPGGEPGVASLDPVPDAWMNPATIQELFDFLSRSLAAPVLSRVELRYAAGGSAVALMITLSGVKQDKMRPLFSEAARIIAPSGLGLRADPSGSDFVLQVDFPLATSAP